MNKEKRLEYLKVALKDARHEYAQAINYSHTEVVQNKLLERVLSLQKQIRTLEAGEDDGIEWGELEHIKNPVLTDGLRTLAGRAEYKRDALRNLMCMKDIDGNYLNDFNRPPHEWRRTLRYPPYDRSPDIAYLKAHTELCLQTHTDIHSLYETIALVVIRQYRSEQKHKDDRDAEVKATRDAASKTTGTDLTSHLKDAVLNYENRAQEYEDAGDHESAETMRDYAADLRNSIDRSEERDQ